MPVNDDQFLSMRALPDGRGVYVYWTDDAIAAVDDSAYFDLVAHFLRKGDMILAATNIDDVPSVDLLGVTSADYATPVTVTRYAPTVTPAGAVADMAAGTGDDVVTLAFPIDLAAITADGDVVTSFKPGVVGTIEHVQFAVSTPVTTAAKAATLNLEIGTTNLTGGSVALTSSNCGTLGAVVENGADPSADNVLAADSLLSVEAASVTAFAEGAGTLFVRVRRNNGTAAKVNALLASLRSGGLLAT